MVRKGYTNKKLAEEYVAVYSKYAGNEFQIYSQASKIREAKIDIVRFFKDNSGLSKLKVRGIGPKTKESLELILRKGVDEADLMTRNRKIAGSNERYKGISKDLEEYNANRFNERTYGDTIADDFSEDSFP